MLGVLESQMLSVKKSRKATPSPHPLLPTFFVRHQGQTSCYEEIKNNGDSHHHHHKLVLFRAK
ncbi:CLUMA_CG010945, isoform A [Clunio marinus]|uniref:CLUMA_CG010945, isoform A n=1 Tax=Clunio marinus TaxID=568069 RepID=A0A1J1IB90_9DIPT|nr:CLUMA_CG010945, isoform A [Clunio marinus]